MCFGAPSNPPVMYRKPVHTIEEIRPYWNGAFRTEEELPAIIEIIEAIPGSPEIEMRTVEVVVDYTPPKPTNAMPPRQPAMESARVEH